MSTIGLNVQQMPLAEASLAATRALSLMATVSHEHDRPRNGKDSLIAMDYVHAENQRNAQTALLHRHTLQVADFFNAFDVEHTAHLTLGDKRAYVAVLGLTR